MAEFCQPFLSLNFSSLCGCVAEWIKALASTSDYCSLCFVQWLCLSVCGSEVRVFEPRLGCGAYVHTISTKGLHY